MKKYRLTILLSLLSPFLLIISIFLMGGGHGYFEPTFVLFPLATILFVGFDTMNACFLLVGLLQYPIYGILTDTLKKRFPPIAVVIILGHIVLSSISFLIRPEAFK